MIARDGSSMIGRDGAFMIGRDGASMIDRGDVLRDARAGLVGLL